MLSSLARFFSPPVALTFAVGAMAAPRSARAEARPHFVHWMTPSGRAPAQAPAAPLTAVQATPADGAGAASGAGDAGDASTTDAGDGGFVNNGRISWQGGPVVSTVKVVVVFWGSGVDPAVVRDIGGFYSTLTLGSFMHYLSEFSTPAQTIGAYGSVLGTFTLSPSNTRAVLTDTEIVTELGAQIGAGVLPPNDPNTIYMVHLPPGVSINDPVVGVSCVPTGFCGYHKSGKGIIYGVLPDFSQGGCAPGPPNCTSCCGDVSPFDTATAVSSHELGEAITDPQPLEQPAWTNPLAGELGDLCNYARNGPGMYTSVYARSGRAYTAQKMWSNTAYVQHVGTPAVGCVDYPTALCCNDSQSACLWLPNGSSACPNPTGDSPNASTFPNGIVITAPTLGGFGSATATVSRKVVSSPPYPSGITNLLGGSGGMSPTIQVTTDTALVGATTACFAKITDATERGIIQCVPLVSGVSCAELKGTTQRTPTGTQCCIALDAQTSVDGTQLCARFPILGNNVIELPALPRWGVVGGGLLLLGAGAFGVRRRLSRGGVTGAQS